MIVGVLLIVVLVAVLLFLFRPMATKPVKLAGDEPVVDMVLVGGGIMSATLGAYLSELEPTWKIQMYERLDKVAQESSNGFHNAGTGHSGFMEMNYTAEAEDGSISIERAEKTAVQFEISKQFWTHQVKNGALGDPKTFINPVPHIALVWGDNVDFLKRRHEVMIKSPLFSDMIYSEDKAEIGQWAPLVTKGRDDSQKIAATRMDIGTYVNYGAITTQLINHLGKNSNFNL